MAAQLGINQQYTKSRRAKKPLIDIFGAIIMVIMALIPLFALILPMVVIVIVSFDSGPILRFPPEEFSFERYKSIIELRGFLESLRLSLVVAGLVAVADLLLGIPASIALVRGKFRAKPIIIGFLQSPMMIPGIVVGISILFYLSFIGLNVSVFLMALSHIVITMPFLISITYARMRSSDPVLEDAARDLGAGRWQVFQHVQFPHLLPGIIGGSAFAFLLSFTNLPTSIFTAPIIDVPMPVYLFRLLIYNIDPVVAPIATLQIILTMIILVIGNKTVGAGGFIGE